jgi:hypothetical protein
MIFTKKRNKIIILSFVFFTIFLSSCSKKEEQKKDINQNIDTLLTGGDSVFVNSTSKVNSTDVKKKFNEKKKNYENELDVISSTEVRFSDFTGDGTEEALLYYTLTAKGGNAMTGSGIVLYKISGTNLEFMLDYNLDGAVIKSIKDGQLNCVKYEYAAGDPNCCPSKKKPFKLKFENNKFNFIP